jgi:hypothetical protein
MPALPTIPNVLSTQLHWNDGTDGNVSSTMFWRYGGSPPNSADCSNFAVTLENAFAAENALWDTRTELTGCTATDLSSNSGGVGSSTGSTNGTLGGDTLAGGTAVVVSYLITRRYRGGKPRNYFPWGDSNSLNTKQLWLPAYVASVAAGMASAISAFIGTVEGATTISAHVNVSYYEGFTVVTSPTTGRARNVPKLRTTPVVDDIVGRTVLGRPGSQRRRNI